MADSENGDHVLFPTEAEAFVQELESMSIGNVGSETWSVQRERLEKLSMQAVLNVSHNSDEFIKEFLISHNKVSVIIHELLVIDVWKRQIFPLLFKYSTSSPTTSFPTYLVLYHEATLISLLEVSLFYQEISESLDENILDLIDYCYRKTTELITAWKLRHYPPSSKEEREERGGEQSIQEELQKQKESIDYGVQIKCLSIIHYICGHLKSLPLSVATRLLNTHDFPGVLVDLIQVRPWVKTDDKGQMMKYEDGKWREIDRENAVKLNKIEGQVWLTIYQLLLEEQSQNKYEYTPFKKEHLLKLRAYITDPVLEQIPPLAALQQYLHQLSFMEPPTGSSGLILEQVPLMYSEILREGEGGKWIEFAQKQSKWLLNPDPEKLKTQATRWVDHYSMNVLETLIDGPPKCSQCGQEATKRCSRCQSEWYCGRECQVKNWKRHKPCCDILCQAQQMSSKD